MDISSLGRTSSTLLPDRSKSPLDGVSLRESAAAVSDSDAVRADAVAQPAETQDASLQQDAQKEAGAGASSKPSEVESFAYGALGLGHPEEEGKHKDIFYTAGKAVAAAITVGSIISVLA